MDDDVVRRPVSESNTFLIGVGALLAQGAATSVQIILTGNQVAARDVHMHSLHLE
jgi:hypothetical protein